MTLHSQIDPISHLKCSFIENVSQATKNKLNKVFYKSYNNECNILNGNQDNKKCQPTLAFTNVKRRSIWYNLHQYIYTYIYIYIYI